MDRDKQTDASHDSFKQLAEQPPAGFLRELYDFLAHSKKWWLAPIVVILLTFGGLILLSSTVAAPFIYTLF